MRERIDDTIIKNSLWEWAFAAFFCLLVFHGIWTYNVLLFQGQRYTVITANESMALAAGFALALTLAIGPAHRLTGRRSNDIRLRRPLALCGTVLASVHILLTAVTERELMPSSVYHLCVALGVLAAALMLFLAVTAWPWALRKLGPSGWKKAHGFAVMLPVLIVAHYFVLGRASEWSTWFKTFGQPDHQLAPSSTFLLTVFCLLVMGLRVVDFLVGMRRLSK